MLVKRINITTLKINYHSGNSMTVEVADYEMKDGMLVDVVPLPNKPYPLILGEPDIESVWVLNVREEVEFN